MPARACWCCRRMRKASACRCSKPWRAGCPVVVSSRGSLPEVAGPAATPVDPDDVEGLTSRMRALLRSPRGRGGVGTRPRAGVALQLDGVRRGGPARLRVGDGGPCASPLMRASCAAGPTGVGRYLAGLLEAWADNAVAQRHQWASVRARASDAAGSLGRALPARRGRRRHHVGAVRAAGGAPRPPARCAVRAGVHCTPDRACTRRS